VTIPAVPAEADYQAAIDALVKAKISAANVIAKDAVQRAAIEADAQAHAAWEADTKATIDALTKVGYGAQARQILNAAGL
jgi:hypothetical protein